jgi:hypothetical protein
MNLRATALGLYFALGLVHSWSTQALAETRINASDEALVAIEGGKISVTKTVINYRTLYQQLTTEQINAIVSRVADAVTATIEPGDRKRARCANEIHRQLGMLQTQLETIAALQVDQRAMVRQLIDLGEKTVRAQGDLNAGLVLQGRRLSELQAALRAVELKEKDVAERLGQLQSENQDLARRLHGVAKAAQIAELRIIALGTIVGGAVITGAGATLGAVAMGRDQKSDAECNGNICTQHGIELRKSAKGFATAATVVTSVGLGVVVIGGALFLTGPLFVRTSAEKRALLVQAGGRF